MSANNTVPNFLPSKSGLHFVNGFPAGTNYPVITLPVLGTLASQDASNGLCGGFVFTVLDLWMANPAFQPPSQKTVPSDSSPLFSYICNRLLDSLGQSSAWAMALKVVAWIQTPGHDTDFPAVTGCGFTSSGLGHRMVFDEWPKIKADIDGGRPSPLSLVGTPECGLGDAPGTIAALHHCHQVLAYGYTLDDSNNLTLKVYDPNQPDDDTVTMALNIGDPKHDMAISATSIVDNLGGGLTIRGIFHNDEYVQKDASSIASQPQIAFTSPAAAATLSGTTTLAGSASNVYAVAISAWYATNPADASTVGWHPLGAPVSQSGGTWSMTIDTTTIPDQGNGGWGTVKFSAFGQDHRGTSYPNVVDNRIVTIKNHVALDNMVATVQTPALPLGTGAPVTFVVHAKNNATSTAVAGRVKVNGAVVGNTDSPIQYTFVESTTVKRQVTPHPTELGTDGKPIHLPPTVVTTTTHTFPTCSVSAAGYNDAPVNLGFHDFSTTTTTPTP
jgi:hypothetical protein